MKITTFRSAKRTTFGLIAEAKDWKPGHMLNYGKLPTPHIGVDLGFDRAGERRLTLEMDEKEAVQLRDALDRALKSIASASASGETP